MLRHIPSPSVPHKVQERRQHQTLYAVLDKESGLPKVFRLLFRTNYNLILSNNFYI